jgi:L-ascorbate metabolism protein UlaG (beta-lactamase superfamily)
LIEPVRLGVELVEEIEGTIPAPGSLSVWWLGQSGFLIKSCEGLLAVDLYLSEHLTRKYEATNRPHVRMTRSPLRGGELRGVDLVLASHKHSDHLDPGTLPELLAASPQAVVVLSGAILEHARGLGLPADRLRGLDARTGRGSPGTRRAAAELSGADLQPVLDQTTGKMPVPRCVGRGSPDPAHSPTACLPGATFERAGFRVRAVPSAHEGLDTDDAGRHLYLGYIIESEGLRLYHSGDSLAYDGLADRLGADRFDVLFLPINGRDPARGVPGNMSASEAVDLAARLNPRFVVPHHYDMFTFNTVPVEVFAAEARRLPAGVAPRILRCGERWEITP